MRACFCIGLLTICLVSCQDVVEVEVPTEEPRLIIDALIRVDTTQPITVARVKVSETRSFFESVPPADLQQITLTGLEGGLSAILLEEEPGSGIYSKEVPTAALIGEEIFLQIDFEDEFFVAYAEFVPTSPIDQLQQGEGNLTGENETEVIVTFTDDGERDDWYLFDFDFANYVVSRDQFFQGQQFSFSYFYDEEFDPGTELAISILGADERFHDYMSKVIEQSSQDFGVFETPALTVRGNIINATEIDNIDNFDNVSTSENFALGYFAIVQEYKNTLTIEGR